MAYQSIQGGALLDALSKLLFKGLDKIFDTAAEYQKDMGVLKQVTRIPVVSKKDGKEYEVVIKLAPIKDRDGMYYVEIDCPNYSDFKKDDVDKQVIRLNKGNVEEFKKWVKKAILDKNNLERIQPDTSDENTDDSSKSDEQDSSTFDFADKDDTSKKFKVTVNVTEDDSNIAINIDSNPALPAKYSKTFSKDNPDTQISKSIENYLTNKCNVAYDEDNDDWDRFLDELDNMLSGQADSDDQETATASINVTLERIVGSDDHEDINLVSINSSSYPYRKALQIVETIVASDEFVDSMPEGVSTYNIIEEDDDYDISPC